MQNKKISIIVITSLLFFTFNSTVLAAPTVDPAFNPDKLIDDSIFSNTGSFANAAAIQSFLQGKNSPLANTSTDFIERLKEPTSSALKSTLEDPRPNLDRKRTAAELIYDSSVSAGLNPQVILVTLNKEQSLITGRQGLSLDQITGVMDISMGFGCPDSGGCGDIYRGFYFQLFGNVDAENNRYLGATKSLMKSFQTPGGRGPFFNGRTTKVGDAVTFNNSTGSYEGVLPVQSAILNNAATAALYRYTPHIFNGNYNFFRFFKEWFGSPTSGGSSGSGVDTANLNNTVVRTSSGSSVYYYIENGRKLRLYEFVAKAKNLNLDNAKTVSGSVLSNYSSNGNVVVPDNTLVSIYGGLYIFAGNKKYPITKEAIVAKGLSLSNVTSVADDANTYDTGTGDVTPAPTPSPSPSGLNEGDVLRGVQGPAVYLVSGGKLKLFTYATFVQYNAASNMKTIADSAIASYPKDGLVLPKNGSLVKSFKSPTVYFYEDGQKKPMDAEIFRNRGFSFANVFALDQNEIDALPLGPFPLPSANTFFKHKKTGQLFWYTNGQKRLISNFVAGQKNITADYTFGEDTADKLTNGYAVAPKEDTIIKGDKSPAVYIVIQGQLRLLSFQSFKDRKITEAQINIVPDAEISTYEKGANFN